jgi:hypothetical protein
MLLLMQRFAAGLHDIGEGLLGCEDWARKPHAKKSVLARGA